MSPEHTPPKPVGAATAGPVGYDHGTPDGTAPPGRGEPTVFRTRLRPAAALLLAVCAAGVAVSPLGGTDNDPIPSPEQGLPEVYVDKHQMGSTFARIFVPPFKNPPHPNVGSGAYVSSSRAADSIRDGAAPAPRSAVPPGEAAPPPPVRGRRAP